MTRSAKNKETAPTEPVIEKGTRVTIKAGFAAYVGDTAVITKVHENDSADLELEKRAAIDNTPIWIQNVPFEYIEVI